MAVSDDTLLRAVSSIPERRKFLNELWNSRYKPGAETGGTLPSGGVQDRDAFIIQNFLLKEENRERQAVWISRILDAGSLLFTPKDKDERETLFAKVFQRIAELDAERSRGANFTEMGKNLTESAIAGLYKRAGNALFKYVAAGSGSTPAEFIKNLNLELKEAMGASVDRRIFSAMNRFEPHERGRFFPLKSHWAGRDDIAQLLLSGTPWAGNLTSSELSEPCFPKDNLDGDNKGFFESCWSLGCEAAQNGTFPPSLLTDYDAMNSVGVRPVRQTLPRPDYREISKFFDMPSRKWYMNYLEPQLFLGVAFASFVSPARIMAEDIDKVKNDLLPDEVLFNSYQGDFFIPPLVFTAYSAFKLLERDEFDDFMNTHFTPLLSRFDKWRNSGAERGGYDRYMGAGAPGGEQYDWHKIPGFDSIGWPLREEFLTRCRYLPSAGIFYRHTASYPSAMEESPVFPERYFKKIINWSSEQVTEVVKLSTGWSPAPIQSHQVLNSPPTQEELGEENWDFGLLM